MQCWLNGLEGIVFDREGLKPILGIKSHIKETRVEWIMEDLEPYFPFRFPFVDVRSKSLSQLLALRIALPDDVRAVSTIIEITSECSQSGISIGRFSLGNRSYQSLVEILRGISTGLVSPSDVRDLKYSP